MHGNQGFYKSEKVLFESSPYLTVPHPFTLCLHRISFNHSQDGRLFVLWNSHQPTIHHISMTKALTLINQNPIILEIPSVTSNVCKTRQGNTGSFQLNSFILSLVAAKCNNVIHQNYYKEF